MISMAMIGMYLDLFGGSLLGWEIMGLIDNMVGFIAVYFLVESVILTVQMIMGEVTGLFKWLGLILAVIELVFAVTALVFIPMRLLLTIAVLVLSGLILILRGIVGK
jgi:hypothetical protein